MSWHRGLYDSRRPAISLLCFGVFVTALFWLVSPSVIFAGDESSGINALFVVAPVGGGAVRQGEPSSAPLAGAAIRIERDGHTVATITTDAEGRFRIPLPPGRYTVAVKGKAGFGRCGPFPVEVVAGEFQTRQWQCDSGLR